MEKYIPRANIDMQKLIKKIQTVIPSSVALVVTGWLIVSVFWVLQSDTTHITNSKSLGQIVAVATFIIGLNISLVIIFTLYKITSHILGLKIPRWFKYILIISSAIIADYLLAWLPIFIWFGEGGLVSTVLPFSSPSTAIVWTPLKYSLRIFGIFGVGGICWAILLFLIKSRYLESVITSICLVSISIIGYVGYDLNEKNTNQSKPEIFVISNNSHGKSNIKLDSSYSGDKLILFPEYGLNHFENDPREVISIAEYVDTKNLYIVGTRQLFEEGKPGFKNELVASSYREGIVDTQLKYRLVPFGEYIPAIIKFPLKAIVGEDAIRDIEFDNNVIRGHVSLKSFEINDVLFAPQICFGIANQADYQVLVKKGANILINPASIGIFEKSNIFHWKNRSLQKMLAVSNMRYFAQSSSGGEAVILDHQGDITKVVNDGVQSAFVTPIYSQTLYSKYGEMMLVLSTVVLIPIASASVIRRLSLSIKSKKI